MSDEVMKVVRLALIIAGGAVLSYFALNVIRTGGHKAGNVAGSLQEKF